MKRLIAVLLLICSLCLLCGCERQVYSYKDITGHEISQIERIETNSGYMQSWRGYINEESFGMLELEFKQTDADIYSLTYGAREGGSCDMPYWTRGIIYVATETNSMDFIIGADFRIYCYSPILQKSFVSAKPLDKSFFEGTGMFE